jgi:hypothetical protein
MKKTILIIFTSILVLPCFSQSKWGFGLSFQPGVGGLLHPEQDAFPNADSIDVYQGVDFSYSYDALVEYAINDRIHICSGINYSRTGFKWQFKKDFYTFEELQYYPSLDTAYANWQGTKVNPRYIFVGIPISLKYILKVRDKFSIFINSGIGLHYLFDGNEKYKSEFTNYDLERNEKINTLDKNAKKVLINIKFSAGIAYNISDRFKILFEPDFQFYPKKIKQSIMSGNLYNIGLQTGIMYQLD